MYDKEKIYDEEINPLMAKIIDICKKNDIQMLSSFALNSEDLVCTTHLVSENFTNESIEDASKVIQCGYVVQKPFVMTAAITTENYCK